LYTNLADVFGGLGCVTGTCD